MSDHPQEEYTQRIERALAERNTILEQARAQVGAHEVYDDAHIDEVDDGYWVTAKIFVPKEPA